MKSRGPAGLIAGRRGRGYKGGRAPGDHESGGDLHYGAIERLLFPTRRWRRRRRRGLAAFSSSPFRPPPVTVAARPTLLKASQTGSQRLTRANVLSAAQAGAVYNGSVRAVMAFFPDTVKHNKGGKYSPSRRHATRRHTIRFDATRQETRRDIQYGRRNTGWDAAQIRFRSILDQNTWLQIISGHLRTDHMVLRDFISTSADTQSDKLRSMKV